jgi:hypothetical protein
MDKEFSLTWLTERRASPPGFIYSDSNNQLDEPLVPLESQGVLR